jgi:hypothetical protein
VEDGLPARRARLSYEVGQRKMNTQELCELAEAELDAGCPDRELAGRALAEAGGVGAKARQVYWLLRAEQLRAQATASAEPERFFREVRANADEKRRIAERRESRRGWFYAFAVYGAFAAAFIFGCAALPAFFRHSDAALRYSIFACVFAAGGLTALVRSKRMHRVDPFAFK